MRSFRQSSWRNFRAADAEGKSSLVGASWTRAGSDFAYAWVLAGLKSCSDYSIASDSVETRVSARNTACRGKFVWSGWRHKALDGAGDEG